MSEFQFSRDEKGNVYRQEEVDRQIEESQIPASEIPRHIGGDRGAMEGRIREGSDTVIDSGSGYGRSGGEEVDEAALPGTNDIQGNGEYGSATVVSLSEMQDIDPEFDPSVPKRQRTAAEIIAQMRRSGR